MREILTLEHLSAYFPYGLNVLKICCFGKEVLPLTALMSNDGYQIITVSNTDYYLESNENEFEIKPILRPLSDLTKEIEIKGESFIPALLLVKEKEAYGKWKDIAPTIDYSIKIVQKEFGKCLKVTKLDQWVVYLSLEYPERIEHFLFKKLLEMHFDVFGLIEKGLAIDINTLE